MGYALIMKDLRGRLSLINKWVNPFAVAVRLLPARGRLFMLAIAALLSLVLLGIFSAGFETLEERLGAQGWVMSADMQPEERITIIDIDEASLAEIGPWPWSRDDVAWLVESLNQAGVQLQLHDIVFDAPRPGDDRLLAALQQAPGAVLAQTPLLQSDQQVRTGNLTHPLTGISCEAWPNSTSSFIANHSGLDAIPKGHIAPLFSSDGSIRKVPAFACVDGVAYPALAVSALLQATNASEWQVSVEPGEGWFDAPYIMRLAAYPGLAIPLDEDGNLRVSYKDSPLVFGAVSAADVMNGRIQPGSLDNTWVLVGGTAFGMADIVPTPYNGFTPGIELQARLLGSLLDTRMPFTPTAAIALQVLLTMVFAGVLFGLAGARERVSAYGLPVAAVVMPALALAIHWQLLISQHIWLGWTLPAVYSVFAASLLLLMEQYRVRSERTRVFSNLNSYLPGDVAREIAYALPSSSINAKRRDVTLLSADLRNFAAFGEARPPEESAAILHFFFVRTADIVERHGGYIHEFKGDSVLAVWEGQNAESARNALRAAQEMQDTIQKDMPQNPPAGLEPLALGIGIEQGPALVGSIGPAHRRTHTLLGDTVTITLRIQELTAELAHPILLGDCVARQLSDLNLESQGSYLLDGLRIPHTLFAPAADLNTRQRGRPDQPSLKIVSGGKA